MEPDISDGDFVVVARYTQAEQGNIALVHLEADTPDGEYTITDIENKGLSFSFTLTDDAALPVSLGDDLPTIVSIEDDRCRIVFENIYGEKVVYGW